MQNEIFTEDLMAKVFFCDTPVHYMANFFLDFRFQQ